jgi:Papain family cysteine protease
MNPLEIAGLVLAVYIIIILCLTFYLTTPDRHPGNVEEVRHRTHGRTHPPEKSSPAMNAQRITQHAQRHWHHHLAIWFTAAALAILLFTGGVTAGIIYAQSRGGGEHKGPLPPRIKIKGGPLPSSWNLQRLSVRTHDQDNSSSCVAQTLSTIEEFTQAKRSHKWSFSAGFIYDQINGGQDAGASYQDAFAVLTNQGDPGLSVFPHDGIDWWVQPDATARARALPYRFSSWRSIAPSDSYTMQAELHAGRPIAIAIDVTDSFYGLWGSYASYPIVSGQAGAFHFRHSITGIGYTPDGVIIQNSWGRQWGASGRAILSWSFLSSSAGAEIVVSSPRPPPPPKPPLSPALAKVWQQFRSEHHLKPISFLARGKLIRSTLLWKAHVKGNVVVASHTGGITRLEQYNRHARFELDTFQGSSLYWWPHHTWLKWKPHRWLR